MTELRKRTLWWAVGLVAIALAACGGQAVTEGPAGDEAPVVVEGAMPVPPADGDSSDSVEEMEVSEEQGGDVTEIPGDPPTDDAFSAPVTAQGEVIMLFGRVLDVNGGPVAGAAVEIWQTDTTGVYDHPGDPGTGGRDRGFQFYGTAITDSDGGFSFRTVKPAAYESRPPHIHFKVKLDGATLLTSQFYFAEDSAQNSQDGIAAGAGNAAVLALDLSLEGGLRGAAVDVVVDTGIGGGSLALFPAQGEGPYYPVVTVADFDNDLASK